MLDDIHEECGICAVYVKENGDAANKGLFYLYKLMLNQQNRGQLSAGVTTYNPERSKLLDTYKKLGHVNEVFQTISKNKSFDIFKKFSGNRGIGHVRYATSGTEDIGAAQPFERPHGKKWKWFSFGFNGNLANYSKLKQDLLKSGEYHLNYDNDTEIIMHYLSLEMRDAHKKPDMVKMFRSLSEKFDGCYNIAYMNAEGEIAVVRDPYGFRPVVYGWSPDKSVFMVASESTALINCGITDVQSLEPGYLIHIEKDSVKIKKYAESKRKSHCMFEWVYFSNVSSVLDDRSVYLSRTQLGKELAKLETEKPSKEHIVVPVPDTAKAAGDAYAYALGIPSTEGIIRNRYIGRTFIEGSSRHDRVQNKYTALKQVMKGKKVLLVDDSIVRGNTTRQLVKYLKEVGGAKEVHLRISCPPIRGPCFYGIDMSTVGELLVPRYEKKPITKDVSKEVCAKIAKDMGADSLIYQSIQGLINAIKKPKNDMCLGCINGEYPTPTGQKLIKLAWSNFKKGIHDRTYEKKNSC